MTTPEPRTAALAAILLLVVSAIGSLIVSSSRSSAVDVEAVIPENPILAELRGLSIPPRMTDPEPLWTGWLAQQLKGEPEALLPDGSRVDVLSTVYATEVEWIGNWEQAIGQSLYYAILTDCSPRIILLRRHEPGEANDYLRCKLVCQRCSIELRVVDARTGAFER